MNDAGIYSALYAAKRSCVRRFHTGAAIVDGNDVVSIGWSHPAQTRRQSTPWSTHAELHACQRAQFEVTGLDVYVANFSARGNLTHAAPCDSCAQLLSKLGVNRVYVTTPKGWVEVSS